MAYLGRSPSQGVRNRYYKTASGGETSISGALTGGTLTFTDGNYVDVNLNGVTLVAGTDYNTNTANTIAGLSALTASDVVEIVVYDVFSVFSGNVNSDFSVGGNLSVTGTTAFTGATTITGLTTTGDINFGDNDKAQFGAGNDLQIYHDSSNSYVKDAGTGDLLVQGTQIKLQDASGNDYLRGFTGGAVYLHHAGNSKFETTSSGVSVTGGFTASDGCTITTADNTTQLTLTSTDADAAVGPVMDFNRNSASAADNDLLGRLNFIGKNDAGEDVEYGLIRYKIADASDGSEDGDIAIRRMVAGTSSNVLNFKETETIFNEDSKDIDFRVESLGDANSFVVEGATKGIGMGTNDPTIDSSLAGVSVPGGARVLHIHDSDGAYIKISDPSSGSNRGASIGQIGTNMIINNCEADAITFGTGNTYRARITSGGRLQIGTTTGNPGSGNSSAGMELRGDIGDAFFSRTDGDAGYFNRNNDGSVVTFSKGGTAKGNVEVSDSGVAFNTSSDYRLKENITSITNATDRLKQLNPVRFNFIADADTTVDGFLAHEVSDIVPEAISGEKDAMKDEQYEVTPAVLDDDGNEVTPAEMGTRTVPDYQGIDQSKLVPLLVATIQELEARIATLEAAE